MRYRREPHINGPLVKLPKTDHVVELSVKAMRAKRHKMRMNAVRISGPRRRLYDVYEGLIAVLDRESASGMTDRTRAQLVAIVNYIGVFSYPLTPRERAGMAEMLDDEGLLAELEVVRRLRTG